MPAPSAELEYLFRHGVMRDAAYQLILPSERHALHRDTALVLHENTPEADREAIADEIADHATLALEGTADESLLRIQHAALRQAGSRCHENYELARAAAFLQRFLQHPLTTRDEKLECSIETAGALLSLGRGADAESVLNDALELCGDDRATWQGRIRAGLGGVYMETGRLSEADDEFARAIEIHRAEGDRRYLGIALTNRAIHFRHTGRGESPRRLLEEALAIHREVGNKRFEGRTLLALAGSYRTAEDNETAGTLYLEAKAIFESLNATFELAQTWGNLANVFLVTDQHDRAEEAYLRALKVVTELGAQRSIGIVTGNLASLLWSKGRLMQSLAASRRAIRALELVGDRPVQAAYRADLGGRLLLLGDIEEATRQLERSAEGARDIPGSIAMIDYILPTQFQLHLARACGVYGPGVDLDRRHPDAFADAEAVLKEMRRLEKTGQSEQTVALTRQMSGKMKRFIQARNAVEAGTPVQLFNGLDLRLNSPTLRVALLARLKETAPESFQHLKETNAEYFAEILEGTEAIPEPDWHSDDLPEWLHG